MSLTNEQIMALLASGRTRNAYAPKLDKFNESDEPAIEVTDAFPEFKGKNPATLYQGFNNAIKASTEDSPLRAIQVRQSDGKVYLLHTARVQLALASTDAPTD